MLENNSTGKLVYKVVARLLIAAVTVLLIDFIRLNWSEFWAGAIRFVKYSGAIELVEVVVAFLLGSVAFFIADLDISEGYRKALMYKWRIADLFVVKSSISFGSQIYMEGVINFRKVYGILFKADDGLIIFHMVSGGRYALSQGLNGLDVVVNRPENRLRFYNSKVLQIMKEHRFIFDTMFGEVVPVRMLMHSK